MTQIMRVGVCLLFCVASVQVFYRRAPNSDSQEEQLVQLATSMDDPCSNAEGWLPVDVGGGDSALPDADGAALAEETSEVVGPLVMVPHIVPSIVHA